MKTIALIGTFVFNIAALFSLVKQYKDLPKKQGEAVSKKLFISAVLVFTAMAIYSFRNDEGIIDYGILLSSVMMLPINALVTFRLWKERGFAFTDKITWFVFTLPVILLFIVDLKHTEDVMVYMFAVRGIFIADQPWQIVKKRTRGAVDVAWLIVFGIANIFWALYFHATAQYKLEIISHTYTTMFFFTAILWFLAPKLFKQKTQIYAPWADEFQRM